MVFRVCHRVPGQAISHLQKAPVQGLVWALILKTSKIAWLEHLEDCLTEQSSARQDLRGPGISFKSPLIFSPNLLLFLRREVILDMEVSSDCIWSLAHNDACHLLAAEVK